MTQEQKEKEFLKVVSSQVTKVVNGKTTLDRIAFRNLPENVRFAYTKLLMKYR